MIFSDFIWDLSRANKFFHILTFLVKYIQGVPKGMDTFQPFKLENWITYELFFHINKNRIKCHFLNNSGKTLNLNFIGLTGVNSLCTIYFNKDA